MEAGKRWRQRQKRRGRETGKEKGTLGGKERESEREGDTRRAREEKHMKEGAHDRASQPDAWAHTETAG